MNKEEYSTKIEFLREVFPNLAEDVIVARLQSASPSERSTDALVSYFLSEEEKENAPPQQNSSNNIVPKDLEPQSTKSVPKSKYLLKDDDEEAEEGGETIDLTDESLKQSMEEVSLDPVTYSEETGRIEKSAEQMQQEENDLVLAQQLYEEEIKRMESQNNSPQPPPFKFTYVSPYDLPPRSSSSTSTTTTSTTSKKLTTSNNANNKPVSNKRIPPPVDKEAEKRAKSAAADQLQEIRKMHENQWKATGGKPGASNANKSGGGGFNAGYYNQLKEVREKHNRSWHDNKATQKRVWTIGDIEEATKQAHVESGKFSSGDSEAVKIGKMALELTNKFRKENKLPALAWHSALCNIGAVHSKNMAEHKVKFGHAGFDMRIKQYPMQHRTAAENVAMSRGVYDVAGTAVRGWITSPGHRIVGLDVIKELMGVGI